MKDSVTKFSERIDYNSINIYKEARITRDKYTKIPSLEINVPGKWSLFRGKTIDSIDVKNPIAEGSDKGIYQLYTGTSEREYFKVCTDYGNAVLAEKHLPMEGGYNFRDLGGMETLKGEHIKWGKLFRSDDLYNLTEDDLKYLSGIPITTIVDFRCDEEYTLLPDKFPESLKNYYNLSIHPGSVQDFAKNNIFSEEKVIDAMKSLYRLFVTEREYINTYKEFFRMVQEEDHLPLLFHCSAGKDRTGIAAVLFLFALDIPKETIIQDYMDSNYYLADKYQPLFEQNPANKYLYSTIPEYLETALYEIDDKYGNIDAFLTKELKIDREKLKKMFLF